MYHQISKQTFWPHDNWIQNMTWKACIKFSYDFSVLPDDPYEIKHRHIFTKYDDWIQNVASRMLTVFKLLSFASDIV